MDKVVLFDIDGTLLLSGGAGSRALDKAFEDLFAFSNGMEGIRPDGKTDPVIIREVLSKHIPDLVPTPELNSKVLDRYLVHLEGEIAESPGFRIMPGVRELLDACSGREDVRIGLATGNVVEAAMAKLRRAGLHEYFAFGGYGSDSADRTELIRLAVKRAGDPAGKGFAMDRSTVVGDTPRDIVHGREAGARIVAVATGRYSEADLAAYAPDAVFKDLTDIDAFFAVLEFNG